MLLKEKHEIGLTSSGQELYSFDFVIDKSKMILECYFDYPSLLEKYMEKAAFIFSSARVMQKFLADLLWMTAKGIGRPAKQFLRRQGLSAQEWSESGSLESPVHIFWHRQKIWIRP